MIKITFLYIHFSPWSGICCLVLTTASQCVCNIFEFKNYSLLFFFSKSKDNQLREATEKPWHVYSNTDNPFLYPFLALAQYVISNLDILKNRELLFPGNHQYTQLMNIFLKVIKENKLLFEVLGIRKENLVLICAGKEQ